MQKINDGEKKKRKEKKGPRFEALNVQFKWRFHLSEHKRSSCVGLAGGPRAVAAGSGRAEPTSCRASLSSVSAASVTGERSRRPGAVRVCSVLHLNEISTGRCYPSRVETLDKKDK